jgi:uncharacterized protein (TIGR02118 family)
MIKAVIFFKRKPDMSVAAFQEHWRTRHAAIIARLPGLRRYVQNATLASEYAAGEPLFDAVAESSFEDTQAMKALAGTPHYAAVLADEPNFIDAKSMGSIITEEHVARDGSAAPGAVKEIAFLKRKPGMPLDEFFRHWREVHAPLCAAVPALRRCVQNATRRSIYASGRTPAWDGVAMSWYDSAGALREATADLERARADFARFTDGVPPRLLAREHTVV